MSDIVNRYVKEIKSDLEILGCEHAKSAALMTAAVELFRAISDQGVASEFRSQCENNGRRAVLYWKGALNKDHEGQPLQEAIKVTYATKAGVVNIETTRDSRVRQSDNIEDMFIVCKNMLLVFCKAHRISQL